MYVAKQARNEETRRRNMRVRNCQRSRLGFVARQLCGHHRKIYRQIEIWPPLDPPLAILARSPRDKFINLATLGGPSALLASRGINNSGYGGCACEQACPILTTCSRAVKGLIQHVKSENNGRKWFDWFKSWCGIFQWNKMQCYGETAFH